MSRTDTSEVRKRARTLTGIATHARGHEVTRKDELVPGDRVIVSTRNSVYCLFTVGDGKFVVSGGWFDRNRCDPLVRVNGCTYGGRAIRPDIVAGRGLFLEFANNVCTTRIQDVRVVRHRPEPLPN